MNGAESFAAGVPMAAALQTFQRDYLIAALRAHGGHLGRAAEAIGMCRQSLSNYMRSCGVDYLEVRRESRPPDVAEKRVRQAATKRRHKLRSSGRDENAPKRIPKPVKQRVVPVLVKQPQRGPAVVTLPVVPRSFITPVPLVRVDECGWAEGA